MGGGIYSVANATTSRLMKGASTNTMSENFKNRSVIREMNSVDITVREARDSDEHPNSLAIILGLDVTGSMGSVPQHLVRDGLPNIMGKIIQMGEPDPQVLFLGIGDHECDHTPLQVGQFESNDEKLDHWLENTYLEGGGGGNYGESYLLAWYFAAKHTSIDCMIKRKRKGVLITIGDEAPLRDLPVSAQEQIMGKNGQYSIETAAGLLERAQTNYDVYHIHLNHHGVSAADDWTQLMGDNLIVAQSVDDITKIAINIISDHPDPSIAAVTVKTPDTHKAEEVL